MADEGSKPTKYDDVEEEVAGNKKEASPVLIPDGTAAHIASVMKRYDTDANGKFSPGEVREIVRDVLEEKARVRSWQKISGFLLVMFLIMCGWLIAGVYLGNEASKEQHVRQRNAVPITKDLNNQNVRTQNAEEMNAPSRGVFL